MRTMKMMLVASLVAACGEVSDPSANNGSGSDSMGSDMGSGSDAGSGSGSGMDAGGSGSLTIDATDFIVQNNVWWTNTSGPTLHGTFQGPAGAAVSVTVDSGTPMSATLTGSTWAISLPANTITSSAAAVKIALTDASGSDIELAKTIGLDSAPPSITVQGSSIHDERGDTIDFSTGEPIHTHAGALTDLGGAGCPAVYKYAYLMDAAPTFGSSTSANDLMWKFRIDDAKLLAGSQQFRVRSDANAVLVPWTALPATDAAGYSSVKLTRNGGAFPIASLGTRAGQFFIDVRATDWGNHSTTSSFCFDNHPLAAPLSVSPFKKGALFGYTVVNDADIAAMMQSGATAQVVTQEILQETAEPVTIAWTATAGSSPAYSSTSMSGWVAEYTSNGPMCQPGNTNPQCVMATAPTNYPAASESSATGTLGYPSYTVTLRDEVTGSVLASASSSPFSTPPNVIPPLTWTIPARTASEAPHGYRFEISLGGYSEIVPILGLYSEDNAVHTLMGATYTGGGASNLKTQCSEMEQTAFGPHCRTLVTYWDFTAFDQATLAFQPFASTITTGPDAQTLSTPSYVPASTLTSGAFTWDSGNDDLPGPF